MPAEYAERAVYVVEGSIDCGGSLQHAGTMRANVATLRATDAARVMLLGGDALDGARHIWWNFVSSSLDRIERAKDVALEVVGCIQHMTDRSSGVD